MTGYAYDPIDAEVLADRAAEFRDQVARRLSGELTEEQFKPLRLMNGLYLQLHAYMLRVAIPYGVLSSRQLHGLADVARRFDRGYGHFTTRQNVQFNWQALDRTPEALNALAAVDLHAIQTSGNCIRNTTSDPYAGAVEGEADDPRVWSEAIRQWSTLHPEFSWLPRKFKIAVTASEDDRTAARVHDVGLVLHRDSEGRLVFRVMAGGGLGRTPYVGQVIREALPADQLFSYLSAVLRTYNRHGRRDNLFKARIKILVATMGAQAFASEVEAEWAQLDPACTTAARGAGPHPHPLRPRPVRDPAAPLRRAGGRACRRPGAGAVRAQQRGGAQAARLRAGERLLEDAGRNSGRRLRRPDGRPGRPRAALQLRRDPRHPRAEPRAAPRAPGRPARGVRRAAADRAGRPQPRPGHRHHRLPGLDYCALANARAIPLAQEIALKFAAPERAEAAGAMSVNISGCINACGHHHVAAVGILGVDKKGEEFYQLTLGGRSDAGARVGDMLGPALPYARVAPAVEALVDAYLREKEGVESFVDTYARVGLQPFKEAVYADAHPA